MNNVLRTAKPAAYLAALALMLFTPIAASAADTTDDLLVILTSADAQSQGMALVLSNQAAKQGTKVHLLLCGPAGDLALRNTPRNATLKTPKGSTMLQGLLAGLQAKGAKIDVCALYLPGRNGAAGDLADGIGIARPKDIADEMMDGGVRLATF
jgi:predicted peroxiredoxin